VIHDDPHALHTLIPVSTVVELAALSRILGDPPDPHRSTTTTTTKLFLSSSRQHWRTSWK